MSAASGMVQRLVSAILRQKIGPTKGRLAGWRNSVIKHHQRVPVSSTARLRFATFITSSLVASRAVGFWSSSQSDTKESNMAEKEPQASSDAEIIEKADRLYQANELLPLHEFLLQHKDSNNEEILWRLCRATRDVVQMVDTSAKRKKELTYDSFGYAKRCLEINDKNFASHKWFAICISEVGDYEGTKKKITDAYLIRDHFQKAIDLNPMDATCYHLMGLWCFTFAEMPWYQQKIAAVIFGTPPSSTFEEALGYFKKGEEISPGFYSKNLLMLGRTCLEMKNKEEAKAYFEEAKAFVCKKDEDREVVKKATNFLKSL